MGLACREILISSNRNEVHMNWEAVYSEVFDIGREDDHPLIEDIEFRDDGIHENIYSAAVGIHLYYSAENDVYRGHAKRGWELVPTIYRNYDNSFLDEIRKMSSLTRFLQDEYGFTIEDALAITKHYSNEADVKSWLLDVTFDHEVACFFASNRALGGEIGEIYLISLQELDQFYSDTAYSVGSLGVHAPEGVPRIERQDAAFIDRSHHQLLNGYVHWRIKFIQHEGIKFENPANNITEDYLLPQDDEFLSIIEDWKENTDWRELSDGDLVTPPHRPTKSLTKDDFLIIAKSWLEDMGSPFDTMDEDRKTYLKGLCEIHAFCSNNEFSEGATSLHNLYLPIKTYLVNMDTLQPFESISSSYLTGANARERKQIEDKISEIDVS